MKLRFLLGLAAVTIACSSTGGKGGSGFDPKGDGGGGGSAGSGGNPGSEGSLGGFEETDGGAIAASCAPSPENYDIPGNNCDDDGDGKVDNAASCDTGLAATGDAAAFARALGLCQTTTGADKKWGIVSATFSNGHGRTTGPNDAQHGILPKFGNVIKPREGKTLGVLSSGWAREYDGASGTPDFRIGSTNAISSTSGAVPPGFPKAAAGCPIDNAVHDVISLKLTMKAPSNAKGFSFDFNFFSGEWPDYVCSDYNDAFIAYLSSKAFNNGTPDNISFDAQKNPVSVNNGFFDRCTPNSTTGCAPGAVRKTAACAAGVAELKGTGFGEPENNFCVFGGGGKTTPGGATGWLTTQAPVEPNETFTLEFIIWDTGDHRLDSSVLLDNFQWIAGEVKAETQRPPK
jgi:hypothetical protein